jgi:SAM-dependent methyltransferase
VEASTGCLDIAEEGARWGRGPGDPKRLATWDRLGGVQRPQSRSGRDRRVSPGTIECIDSSVDCMAYAKVHVNSALVTFEVGAAQALPIDSASFDVVVSGLILNFVPKPRPAPDQACRRLRPLEF